MFLQTQHIPGNIVECGVYRGGTATMLANLTADKTPYKKLLLFDTFTGIPCSDANYDSHKVGDFHDTNLEDVKK